MIVRLVFNAGAGYGRGRAVADQVEAALHDAGHAVVRSIVGAAPAGVANDGPCDALVVIGGDGTVHHELSEALCRRVPIYQFAAGTENLFARDWSMKPDPSVLVRALARGRVVEADVGLCNAEPFCLMCSVGFDAAVIHRRARGRPGLGHRGYVVPVLEQLAEPAISRVRIRVDGLDLVDAERGVCIVANSRQYALRLDPACRADPTDGLLDVVFLPCEGPLGAAKWGLAARLGVHRHDPALVYRQGREIEVVALDADAPCQIDGEPLGAWEGRVTRARESNGHAHQAAGTGGERASLHVRPAAPPGQAGARLHCLIRPGALRVLDARGL
ncbi:MAG: diacylglycerol kinase family protein [Phycisphaerales bacterium]